jgi:hypothetical protein
MPAARRAVLRASQLMAKASRRLPWLGGVADSVYVNAMKE